MIDRAQVRDQLQAWLDGKQSAEQTWHWAMAAQARIGEGEAFEDALVRDITDVLAALPQDLVIKEDAEVMLYGLNNPVDEADLAQNLLWNHMDSVDSEGRRYALQADPFYGEFCGPVT